MMGILIFQDLCVVPLMLITPMLAGEDIAASDLLLTMLKAMGIIVSVLIAARWVVPVFLHQVVRTRSRELFLITVIFVCLGTALVTSRFGLSLALGAFLAGLVLSESEYAYQATAEILPFKDSFLGIFFVSIGMLLDTTFVINNFLLVSGAVLFILIVKSFTATLSIFLTSSNYRAAIQAGIGLALF
jgi:CPA2 family monovalent cation:H+ antiporter-2